MKRPVLCSAVAAAMLALGGCAGSRGGPVPYDVQGFGAPDVPQATDAAVEYRIGPGDVLNIAVFRVPTLTGDVTVDALGNFNLPLVGQVAATGKTANQLATELQSTLAAKYLKDPQIQVTVKQATSQRVTIDGSVNAAGVYPIPGRISLLQALALARGPDKDANPRRVVVFRQIKGQRNAAAFDLTAIRQGQSPDPTIYGDDIIVVDGSKTRGAFRDIISSIPLLAIFRPF